MELKAKSDVKNSFEGFISRLDQMEEKINELKESRNHTIRKSKKKRMKNSDEA